MKKWMKIGTRVRRKRPHFDEMFENSGYYFKKYNSIDGYYLQEGVVTSGGSHIVKVKWCDGKEYKYGLAVLEEIGTQWKLDDKLFEI